MSKGFINADMNSRAMAMAMKAFAGSAFPKAVADTLNQTADSVTKQQIRNVKSDFTIRAPYTLKSMVSNRAKPFQALGKAFGKNVDRMMSVVGTFSKYLWLQENNNTIKGLNGGAVPIATLQARTSKSEKKAVRKIYRLAKSDRLKDGPFGQSGYFRGFVGTPRGGDRNRGLYMRSANNKRLTMLRNLGSRTVKIKGTGFHSKAVKSKATDAQIATRFRRNAENQIRKTAGVF